MTDSSKGKALFVTSLQEFFQNSVQTAIENQGLDTTRETEFYIVNLLETFSQADKLHGTDGGRRDEPFALMLQRAIGTSSDAAIPVYKHIGDLALYTSGFFSRSLRRSRRTVSRSYYYDIGSGAYETLSSLMRARRDRVFASIFMELGSKFAEFVEVLTEIAEQHAFNASSDTDDLLERWARTQSGRAGEKLISEGNLPLLTPDRSSSTEDPN